MRRSSCLFQHLLGLFSLIRYHRNTKSDCWSHTGSQVSLFSASWFVIKLLTAPFYSFRVYTICDTSGMGWIHCSWSHKAYAHYDFFNFRLFNVIWFGFQESRPILSFSVHMPLVMQLVLSCGSNNINRGMQHYWSLILKAFDHSFTVITSLGRLSRRPLVLVPSLFSVSATCCILRTNGGMASNEMRPMMTYI